MKDHKVKALKGFTDKEEKITRKNGDIFNCTRERYLFLKKHNAVELVEIELEEVKEDVEEIIEIEEPEIIEEVVEKPFKKRNRK